MQWQRAEPPREFPSEPAEVVHVPSATLTPMQNGWIRVIDREWRWVTGAVYDRDGNLVPESQRNWDRHESQPAAVDPVAITGPRDLERTMRGRWVFGGHWARHFGHFLMETLTNLWPIEALGADGILALESAYMKTTPGDRRGTFRPSIRPWQAELLELAGFQGRDVVVSRYRHVGVEHLVVPERPVLLHQWVRPEAVALWRRISDAVGERGSARRIYLSRTRFNAETGASATGPLRTDASWDAHLDDLFAAAGFDLVHPEQLTMAEQIALVRGAEVVAGSSGSALHLTAFAPPGTRVLELGDMRTGDRPLRTQRALDAACGHEVAYIGYGDTDALAHLPRLVDAAG